MGCGGLGDEGGARGEEDGAGSTSDMSDELRCGIEGPSLPGRDPPPIDANIRRTSASSEESCV